MIELADAELGYAAGIVDGEGSIQIDRRTGGHFGITVTVSMKNPAVIHWLEDNFGGRTNSFKQSRNSFKPEGIMNRWAVHGTKAQEFISLIKPFMIEKAERANVALSFPVALNGSHRYRAELDTQEAGYNIMKKLQDKPNRGNKRRK